MGEEVVHLLVNATVLTMDESLPVAQALAVKDGRIVEVGGTDEVLWLREDDYEVIDLEGKTVVPGFVDPHNHFSIGAFETLWADCREARSVPEIQQTLAAAARATPAGAWVRVVGYDHRLVGVHPTRGDLDAAVPDRPALLMHFSHHQCVVNSRALAEAGITRGTADPPGGEIARDKAGEPTGLLFERGMSAAETASRAAWEERFAEVAGAASRRYAALGITAIQDAAVTPAMARRYAEARAAGALAIDVGEVMVGSRGWFERPDDPAPGALKVFVDGGYRCAMRVMRDGAPRVGGFLFYTRAELTALLLAAWRAGRRVVCHAIGNLGVETALGAIEDAVREVPEGRDRVRIDHAIFLTPDLIARLADLGIWVVAQPSFLWDARGAPSPDRPTDSTILQRPFGRALRAGVRQAFSSDYPCGSNSPLAGIAAAVTRTSRLGQVAAPEEAISAAAALEAYTLGAARAAGIDDVTGSLEAGKRADLLVLSANPLECPPGELSTIRVLETWMKGNRLSPP
ncbi:MAG TPA: amidohydrolase [Methylomirabilota bacterium]|nr:amidohydrolase [Methylomirabilota bacterium]